MVPSWGALISLLRDLARCLAQRLLDLGALALDTAQIFRNLLGMGRHQALDLQLGLADLLLERGNAAAIAGKVALQRGGTPFDFEHARFALIALGQQRCRIRQFDIHQFDLTPERLVLLLGRCDLAAILLDAGAPHIALLGQGRRLVGHDALLSG